MYGKRSVCIWAPIQIHGRWYRILLAYYEYMRSFITIAINTLQYSVGVVQFQLCGVTAQSSWFLVLSLFLVLMICAVSVSVSPWFNALAAAWQLCRTHVLMPVRYWYLGQRGKVISGECFHLGVYDRRVCIVLVDSLMLGTLFTRVQPWKRRKERRREQVVGLLQHRTNSCTPVFTAV